MALYMAGARDEILNLRPGRVLRRVVRRPRAATPWQRPLAAKIRLAGRRADTGRPIDLPPVRTRLATKFNLLSIALIVLTAVAVTAFVFFRQWTDTDRQLRMQGETLSQMLADLSAQGLHDHEDRK